MVVKRIAAVLAAVALIVGAVLLRQRLNDDDSASTGEGGVGAPSTDASDSEIPTIACITDFAMQCQAIQAANSDIEIRIESWSVTADAIAAGDGPDGWITIAPLANLAAFDVASPAASTQMTVVIRSERAGVLNTACAGRALWRCVGESAGDPWTELGGPANWGKVLPGFPDPTESALGAVLLANAHVGYFSETDLGVDGAESFQSVDTEADADHAGWNARVARSVPREALADPLGLLLQRQSAVNVVATTTAQLGAVPAASAASIQSIDEQPAGRIDAIVVGVGDRFDAEKLAGALKSELQANGWTDPETDADGVPSGATVVLVRNLWKGAR